MRENTRFIIVLGILILMLVLGFIQIGNAQTVKTVGETGADYTTLRSAFMDINAGVITGSIELQIVNNTTELDSAVLYQSGYTGAGGTSNYSAIKIYPTVTGRTISCNLSRPLIDLRGADNVTIDGRLNASGSATDLNLTNQSTSGLTGDWTSTIRFIDGACNNTIKFCKLKGSGTLQFSGIILFSNSSAATGNNGNTIDGNDITNENNNRPTIAICSVGSSGNDNSNNIISNNNIFNVLKPQSATLYTMAIGLHSYTTATTVTGNSFYETTNFTSSNTSLPHYAIFVANPLTSSTYANITNNYIGGSAPMCGGTPWVHSSTGSNNPFTAIYLDVQTVTTSNVQGNVIRNFSYSNSSTGAWTGIYVKNGNVNIGTTSPNIIGSASGNNSIVYSGGASGAIFYGISIASTGVIDCRNNQIGGITATNSGSSYATHFYGLYNSATSGTITYKNNIIGSIDGGTTYGIESASTSTSNWQKLYAIYSAASSGSPNVNIIGNTISKMRNRATSTLNNSINGIYLSYGIFKIANNTIKDLTIDDGNTTNANNASCCGITMTSSVAATQNIFGNTIYNLMNSNSSFAGCVMGIYYMGSTVVNNIYGNFIYGLSVTGASSTNANLYGIKIESGSSTYSNNIINIVDNNQRNIYGIYENGAANNNNNIYYNTVCIAGSAASGANKSYAFFSNASTNIRNIRNNIFTNTRSTTGGTNLHYAAYFNYTVNTNLSLNYNDYFVSGTGGALGYYNNTAVTLLPIVTNKDSNSAMRDPAFDSPGGLLPLNYYPKDSLYGVSIVGMMNDFNGYYRNTPSKMGAIETNSPNTSVDVYNGETYLASYPNISSAVDRINDGTHTGSIIVKVNRNQVLYSNLIFNASGIGGSNFSSITIRPSVSGITISGSMNLPLIDLDGANNVNFDGRVNGTGTSKDMNITNDYVGISAQTLRFINNASYNSIKYCVLKGSPTSGGIIYFGGTNTNSGNNYNLIDNNDITCAADANRPYNAVYSYGTFAYKNGFNTVSNNNIYNFLNRGNASYGVNLQEYNTSWTISGNSFYETNTFVPTASVEYRIINIYNTTLLGDNYNISGNYIGGTSPMCGNGGSISSFTKTNAYDNVFKAIYYNAGGNTGTIQNNVIKNLKWTNANAASNFDLIYIVSGAVNIFGNCIGDTTGTGSITFTAANSSYLYCINILTSGAVNCSNNLIGSVTTANSYTSAQTHLWGIYRNGGAGSTVINNNFIGSLGTVNSLNATPVSTTGQQTVYGIKCDGTGINVVSGNTVSNVTNGVTSTGTSSNDQIVGIYVTNGSNTVTNNTVRFLKISNSVTTSNTSVAIAGIISCATPAAQNISCNTISDLSNANSSYAGCIIGIYFWGPTIVNNVSNNLIYNLSVSSTSTSATLYGIKTDVGATIYSNNIISLGGDTKTTIYGIYENGSASNNNFIYFNTIKISGNLLSGATNKSYALYSSSPNNVRDIRNNILCNARSTTGGASKHYALYLNYTVTTNLTLGYNDYFVNGVGGVMGFFANSDKTLLPVATGLDTGSIVTNPGFPGNKDLGTTAADFKPGVILTGVGGTGVSIDFTSYTRTTPPTLGAIEYNNPMPVELSAFTSNVTGNNIKLSWTTRNESNNAGFDVERRALSDIKEKNWVKIGYVRGCGTKNNPTNYVYVDSKLSAGKYEYRLKQFDYNGNYTIHNLTNSVEVGLPSKFELSQNYPNPFNPATKIDFQLPKDSKVTLKVYDVSGREVLSVLENEFRKADFYTVTLRCGNLASGVYFYKIVTDKFSSVKKMVLVK